MNEKDFKKDIKKEDKRNSKKANIKWLLIITVASFIISIFFSLLCELIMPKVDIFIGNIVMLMFIGIGIVFDIVGVAVQVADDKPFYSMSAKKIKGANVAVQFKKSCDKVSTFCNDVVGDICGIISGSAGVYIATKLSTTLSLNTLMTSLFITGIVSALTVGGKSIGKSYALNNSTTILYNFSSFVSNFYDPNK